MQIEKRHVIAMLGLFSTAPVFGGLFDNTVLVANRAEYNPTIMVDPHMVNAWGISLRPPGAGGHIWVSNARTATTTLYMGDANGVPLHQDGLTVVQVEGPLIVYQNGLSEVTGQVYNAASDIPGQPIEFPVSGHASDWTSGSPVDVGVTSGSAKFIFVSKGGTVNAWRANTASAMESAVAVKDYSYLGANGALHNPGYDFIGDPTKPFKPAFSGVAMTTDAYTVDGQGNHVADNRLYITDFQNGRIQTINNQWQDITDSVVFQHPTAPNPTDESGAEFGPWSPWNIQSMNGRLFVAYGVVDSGVDEPAFDIAEPGVGHIVEYDRDGHILHEFNDTGLLNSPWGMAIAPQGFGEFGGDLLVANFGDGSVAAFDPDTGVFHDYLRDSHGDVLSVDGIWGLTFGNGVSLGDAQSLYYTAGPNLEQDGVLGRITAVPEPASAMVLCAAAALFVRRRRR